MNELRREDVASGLAVLERIAVANEKLIELATEERGVGETAGPPFCPHCGHFNPTIRMDSSGGPMADFVLVAECQDCHTTFYAVPEGWQVFQKPEAALTSMREGGSYEQT